MEKKETMVAHPMGMYEKLYNAFSSGPSMLPFRRPRLTSGTSMKVNAERPKQSDHAQLQAPGDAPTAKVGPNAVQEKAVPTKADVIVPKSSTPGEETLANWVGDPLARRTTPELPLEQPKTIRPISSAAKVGKEVTPPEKDKVAAKTVEPMAQHRSPTSVVPRVATEKGNIGTTTVPTVPAEKEKAAAPAVPPTSMVRRKTISTVVPPTSTTNGKATTPVVPPKTTPNVKAAPAVMPLTATANGKAATHAVTAVASEKGNTAPPTMKMTVTGKDNAAIITAAASMMEKGKAPPPVSSTTNINERSEDFIRRAKNSMRSFSNVDEDQK